MIFVGPSWLSPFIMCYPRKFQTKLSVQYSNVKFDSNKFFNEGPFNDGPLSWYDLMWDKAFGINLQSDYHRGMVHGCHSKKIC